MRSDVLCVPSLAQLTVPIMTVLSVGALGATPPIGPMRVSSYALLLLSVGYE